MRVGINYPRDGGESMKQDLQALNVQNKMAEWATRISERRSSGQSVKSWCKENGICEQTYYKWQRKLLALAKVQQEAQFAEVTPLHDQCCSGDIAITVRVAGGEADIHAGADAGTIETVLRILKSC